MLSSLNAARLASYAYYRIAGTRARHLVENKSPMEEKVPETGPFSSARPFSSMLFDAITAHITAISRQTGGYSRSAANLIRYGMFYIHGVTVYANRADQ